MEMVLMQRETVDRVLEITFRQREEIRNLIGIVERQREQLDRIDRERAEAVGAVDPAEPTPSAA